MLCLFVSPPDAAPLVWVFFWPFSQSEAKALEISGHDIFSDEASQGHAHMSETKAAHLQGHDVFADEPAAFVPSRVQSDLKMQRDFYADNVFSETAEPHRPGTAQSRAKAAEICGHDIFSDGASLATGEDGGRKSGRARQSRPSEWVCVFFKTRTLHAREKNKKVCGQRRTHAWFISCVTLYDGEMSGSRAARQAAMGGHDVFSNETGVTRRVVGGVTKPPGGGSTIVF